MQLKDGSIDPTTLKDANLVWRKSRHSNPSGNCVEVAALGNGMIAMRNSRHVDGPVLVYTVAEVAAFVAGAKDGEFDDLLS
ncbi:MAG TPA: DUF397 domain-containing protein [Actinopolymorphaceae bacterium]|jgi:hypothetical protein